MEAGLDRHLSTVGAWSLWVTLLADLWRSSLSLACDGSMSSALIHSRSVKVKRYSSSWQVISELRGVTCHIGSHSVTFHPIQVNSPHLTPARQAGTRLTYPGGIEGWVDLGDLLHTEMVYLPADVTHPSTNQAQCQLTLLIKPTPLTTTLRRQSPLLVNS